MTMFQKIHLGYWPIRKTPCLTTVLLKAVSSHLTFVEGEAAKLYAASGVESVDITNTNIELYI